MGWFRLDALDRLLAADPAPALVSIMLANNETGAIQPAAEIAAIAHANGALFHCDAIQALGKVPVDAEVLKADLLSLSAHKIGGPQGIGALVAREGVPLSPLLRGGGQERSRRAGTENVPGIAGFGAAAAACAQDGQARARMTALRDRLESDIRAHSPHAVTFGATAARLPNTSAIAMPGMPSETQIIAFDLAGIMVSAGAACSSGKVRPSHVLEAMGVSSELARATIRVSLGPDTTSAEIDCFVAAWLALEGRISRRSAAAA